jgi:uncharacterized protein (DUF1499 family)
MNGAHPEVRPLSLIALSGFSAGILALLFVAIAGPGTQLGWWDFRRGFTLLAAGSAIGLLAVVLSIAGAIRGRSSGPYRGFPLAATGFLFGLLSFGVPYLWFLEAKKVPPIHDITTDPENPPAFVEIVPLRRDAPNPIEYGGEEIEAQQRRAYPEIHPFILDFPPDQAFERAVRAARSLDWEIVSAVPEEGRIEATDTTFWFGFKDDIIIRITPHEHGSRVDVRSVSRVGKSDAGTNARRVGKFLKRVH